MRQPIRDYFDNWTTFEKVWLAVFTAIGIGLSLYWGSSVISMAAMVVMWSAYLVNAVYGYWNWTQMEGAQ